MAETFIFTAAKLHSIIPPKDKEDVYRDQREMGLILRVRPSCKKTFYFYRAVKSAPIKVKIGYFPYMSVVNEWI